MSSSTKAVQNAASAYRRAAPMNDDMETASGSRSRHGCGAKQSSREGRRTREDSVRGVRARATGPEETKDCLEA